MRKTNIVIFALITGSVFQAAQAQNVGNANGVLNNVKVAKFSVVSQSSSVVGSKLLIERLSLLAKFPDNTSANYMLATTTDKARELALTICTQNGYSKLDSMTATPICWGTPTGPTLITEPDLSVNIVDTSVFPSGCDATRDIDSIACTK